MADSREDAYRKLESTKEYVFAVAEEFNIGLKKGWFKPKENKEHKALWIGYAGEVEKPFVAFYNQTHNDGISYANAGDVQETCSLYMNRARDYHQKLEAMAKASSASTVTPVAPEDKPPPSLIDKVVPAVTAAGDTAKSFAIAAGVGLMVYLLSRR